MKTKYKKRPPGLNIGKGFEKKEEVSGKESAPGQCGFSVKDDQRLADQRYGHSL